MQVIHYILDLFKEHEIIHWLHFGTLLGAVRNNKIIPWDSDGDIGVLAVDKNRVLNLKNRILDDGYGFYIYDEDLLQIGYSPENWTYCDIWFYHEIPARKHGRSHRSKIDLAEKLDKKIHSDEPVLKCPTSFMQVDHTCDFPKWFIDTPWQIPLEGKLAACPRHPGNFLEFIYGDEWPQPQPKRGNGACGNYHPLSHWLKFVDDHKLESANTSNYQCRVDTPACDPPNQCCANHVNELLRVVTGKLRRSEIWHSVEGNEVYVKPTDFQSIKEMFERKIKAMDCGYVFYSYNARCEVHFSEMNSNMVKIFKR